MSTEHKVLAAYLKKRAANLPAAAVLHGWIAEIIEDGKAAQREIDVDGSVGMVCSRFVGKIGRYRDEAWFEALYR